MTVLMREDAAAVLVKQRRPRPLDAIDALGKVLEGRGNEPVSKSLAADDANALAEDEPSRDREPTCPKCGRIFKNPGAIVRHQMATGHGSDRPDRDDTNNYAHGDDLRDELKKAIISGAPLEENLHLAMRLSEATKLEKALDPGTGLDERAATHHRVEGKRQCTVCGTVIIGAANLRRHQDATGHRSHGPVYE